MQLRIHATEKNVKVLGPGSRFVIWVQGCHRRCPGCMSPETWALNGGEIISTQLLSKEILQSGCNGITISGGEPFLQAKALAELIHLVRKCRDIGVIVYTGNVIDDLKESSDARLLLEVSDLLIDGAYIEEQRDGKNLRGSANQRAIALTSRYEKEAELIGTGSAEIEFFFHDGVTRIVGVPTPEWLERMKHIKW